MIHKNRLQHEFILRQGFLSLCLLSVSCAGTIIGNGLKPDDDSDDPAAQSTGSPDEIQVPAETGGFSGIQSHKDALDAVLSTCANPFTAMTAEILLYNFSYGDLVKTLQFTKSESEISAELDGKELVVFSKNEDADWASTRHLEFPEKTSYECGAIEVVHAIVNSENITVDEYSVTVQAYSKDLKLSWQVPAGTVETVGSFRLEVGDDETEIFGERIDP